MESIVACLLLSMLGAPQADDSCCKGRTSPAIGMHCIDEPVKWYAGMTREIAGARRFWRADVKTEDGKHITLIVGQWAGAADDPHKRDSSGIRPPLDTASEYDTKISLCHTPSKDKCDPEILEIENGFLAVRVSPATPEFEAATARIPYPLIIRNRAIAAGAQQTTFVVMGIMDGEREIHQRVYRPNQEATDADTPMCDKAADSEWTEIDVRTEHADGNGNFIEHTTRPRYIQSGGSWPWPDTNSLRPVHHREFLTSACAFVSAAMAVDLNSIKAEEVKWPTCGGRIIDDGSQKSK